MLLDFPLAILFSKRDVLCGVQISVLKRCSLFCLSGSVGAAAHRDLQKSDLTLPCPLKVYEILRRVFKIDCAVLVDLGQKYFTTVLL